MSTQYYLVVNRSDLQRFTFQADRDYFSTPTPVDLLYSDVATRLIHVCDPLRGHKYPVCRTSLRSFYQLTGAQRKQIGNCVETAA